MRDLSISRRRFLQGSALVGVSGFLAACAGQAASPAAPTGTSTGPTSTGPGPSISGGAVTAPSIPAATTRFTMQPYADSNFYVVGMKRGYFKDAGITIDPEPTGKVALGQEVMPLQLSNGADISGFFAPLLIDTLPQTSAVKAIAFPDVFVGWAVLAPPTSNAKSLQDFMTGGMSYADAVKATMSQLKGHTYAVEVDPSSRGTFLAIAFDQAGMKLEDTNLQLLSDQKTVELAMAGRLDFATPGGAPQTVTLKLAGWKPLLTPPDIIANAAPGSDAVLSLSAANSCLVSNETYLSSQMDTVVRFVSVMYRLIDAIQADPAGTAADQLPFLNSVAGTKLDASALKEIFTNMDPLSNFEDAAKFFVDKSSPYHYLAGYNAVIKQQQKNGILDKSKTYNPDDVMWGNKVYQALLDSKQKYDQKLASLTGTLSADRQAIVDKAKTFYTNRNYLDASRFLDAAAT
jgi:ABC-type nitrate/sulfonate/bicarbonate transport system substrate-binding protein